MAAVVALTLGLTGCAGADAVPAPTAAVAPTSAAPASPALITAATTAASAATTVAPASPTGQAQGVKLTSSGGIAGIRETLTVEPDGSWARTTERAGSSTSAEGRLTSGQLAKLRELIADPALTTETRHTTQPGNRCADAIEYLLVVRSQAIHYSGCGQADKPKVTLEIISLLQGATKGH